jgi:tetratricopeptide (TPR) repeat protein
MFSNWKKKITILLLALVTYVLFSTPGIRRLDKLFREENHDHPFTPSICYVLADISYYTFRYELTIDLTKKNIADFPYNSGRKNAEYRRAACFEKLGDFNQAIQSYERFLVAYPRDKRYESIMERISKLRLYSQTS